MKNLIMLVLLIIISLTYSNLFAQYDYVRENSFTYPDRMGFGEWKNFASLPLAKLPEDAVEEASVFIYAPLLSYKTEVGLGWGFSGNGMFNTNGITYHFSIDKAKRLLNYKPKVDFETAVTRTIERYNKEVKT